MRFWRSMMKIEYGYSKNNRSADDKHTGGEKCTCEMGTSTGGRDDIPSRGTASDVGGTISDKIDKNKQIERSTVISEILRQLVKEELT